MNKNKEDFLKYADIFIHEFPTRTPGGRILSPASINTIYGKKVIKKLNSLTKGNADMVKLITEKLKAEIKFRKTKGSFEYMKAIEAWLNSGSWENEYIITEKTFTGVPKGISI